MIIIWLAKLDQTGCYGIAIRKNHLRKEEFINKKKLVLYMIKSDYDK